MWMRSFWNKHKEEHWGGSIPVHQVQDAQTLWMFHLVTSNLGISHTRNMNTRPTVSIESMRFVFPFCPSEVGNIVIPISKNTWEIEATLLSDFSKFLPLRVKVPLSLLNFRETNPEDFFQNRFTLRSLISKPKSPLLDRGLAEFIFSNTTFTDDLDNTCYCCKLHLDYNSSLGSTEYFEGTSWDYYYYELPQLWLDEIRYGMHFKTYEDVYTFLSCGNAHYAASDFLALFMPFSKTTWVLIFLTIFGWPLVLSFIENDFKVKRVIKDCDALFIGWAMILEQSHLRACNYKRKGPLYCYCGCVLLAILVLSNAFKGDNILTLTKSFELVPLTHIDHVIQAGYKTYGIKSCVFDICIDEFYKEAKTSGDHYTEKKFKSWEPQDRVIVNPSYFFNFIKTIVTGLSVEPLIGCQKKALLGWRDQLKDIEKNIRIKHDSAHIYLGQEFIFSKHKGWRLSRFGAIKVLKRMWTVVESGIYSKVMNISYKPPIGNVFEPSQVKIRGNLFMQFLLHSLGLALAFLIFIVEAIKSIILSLGPFRFSIKNCLQQFQKAFLLGLKYLVNLRNQLLKKISLQFCLHFNGP